MINTDLTNCKNYYLPKGNIGTGTGYFSDIRLCHKQKVLERNFFQSG